MIGVYDATTGKLIDYSDDVASPSFNIETCSQEMWADKEELLTPNQKDRIRQELLSLVTRTIPSRLARANLISSDTAKALTPQLTLPGDPSCREHYFWD